MKTTTTKAINNINYSKTGLDNQVNTLHEDTQKGVNSTKYEVQNVLENGKSLLASYEDAMRLLKEAKIERDLMQIFGKESKNEVANNLNFEAPNKTVKLGGLAS